MTLSGKAAFVTGASGGIGGECARILSEHGARVAIGFKEDKDGAVAVSEDCQGSKPIRIDVADPVAVNEAFDEAEEEIGPVTILVNVAGVTKDKPILKMSDDEWQQVIDINLSGAFFCMRRALKAMVRTGWGRIVNIGSVAGHTGNAGQANYAAAKAGIVGLTKSAAIEMGRAGVTVNLVSPGLVDTALTQPLGDKARQSILDRTLLRRTGTTREVAEAVLFCIEASYMTGQTIRLDGGMS